LVIVASTRLVTALRWSLLALISAAKLRQNLYNPNERNTTLTYQCFIHLLKTSFLKNNHVCLFESETVGKIQ